MMGSIERAIDPEPTHRSSLLEKAINNLSLGLVIFDRKRKIVFCNKRYMEIYRLSSEQVRPGTPVSELLQSRLNLGLKVLLNPDNHVRESVESAVVPTTTVHEFTDGQIITCKVYLMPDGGWMATHEDITERRELSARLKMQHELKISQEEKLRIQTLQFDTAINNMSQGLCFFDGAQRLIVCNDRYLEMYDISRDGIHPGITLAEIVDMRFEAGSYPAMSRDEYLNWRDNIVVSAEPTDSIVELRNGRTFKIRHRPMPDLGWVATHEDITEQRRSEVKIEYMATTTRLPVSRIACC
jgi:PAS domain-containing protein